MEVLGAVGVVLFVLVVGFALQTGLLVIASGLAADRPLTLWSGAVACLIANVVGGVVNIAVQLTGVGVLFSLPISLMVWAGVISTVGDMRISQAFFTAVAMTLLQVLLGIGAFMALASIGFASMAAG